MVVTLLVLHYAPALLAEVCIVKNLFCGCLPKVSLIVSCLNCCLLPVTDLIKIDRHRGTITVSNIPPDRAFCSCFPSSPLEILFMDHWCQPCIVFVDLDGALAFGCRYWMWVFH